MKGKRYLSLKPTIIKLADDKISLIWIILLISLLVFACSASSLLIFNTADNTNEHPAAGTLLAATREALIPTPSPTQTSTPTPTGTPNPTATPTLSITPTSTITPTPTEDVPRVTVLMQAFCRYGPGKAYLYSHGLYPGDRAIVEGRNYSGAWLWIQPENLSRHCWMAASVAEVSGDISLLPVVTTILPHSILYQAPDNVQAERSGDLVVVTWDPVWMTEDDDRGYLIEATICQNGSLIPIAVHTDEPRYEFTDEPGCSGASGGKLYTVEKHGYTDPVQIPWP